MAPFLLVLFSISLGLYMALSPLPDHDCVIIDHKTFNELKKD